ncbi:hypothetical protein [uncultured Chryseobacterium sp.]|uniref:hypothetical protein n=1 Tax=uncultured Chryseobacterium sp. TaxID=259322 RepID=UPI0025D9B17C|nr:hypothetical protein [uncultured Chryseobacterium sp.]
MQTQVRIVNNAVNSSVSNSPEFIDASSNTAVNGSANIGKGLIFPRVDLSALASFPGVISGIPNSFPTRFDGMIVYNTAASGVAGVGSTMGTLTPGFWYYENKSLSVNGGQWKPIGGNTLGIPSGSATTGSVIAVNGQLTVAQLSADFSIPTAITPQMIGNLNREILDNENKYTDSATANSFKASVNGVYEITINVQLSTEYGSYPVLGLWDDTTGKWAVRVNDIRTPREAFRPIPWSVPQTWWPRIPTLSGLPITPPGLFLSARVRELPDPDL